MPEEQEGYVDERAHQRKQGHANQPANGGITVTHANKRVRIDDLAEQRNDSTDAQDAG